MSEVNVAQDNVRATGLTGEHSEQSVVAFFIVKTLGFKPLLAVGAKRPPSGKYFPDNHLKN